MIFEPLEYIKVICDNNCGKEILIPYLNFCDEESDFLYRLEAMNKLGWCVRYEKHYCSMKCAKEAEDDK